jgi:tetrapyrrole methylase family protein/MazG family protein
VARLANVDPEGALQAAVDRFGRRFATMEQTARDEGRELAGLSLDELEQLWLRAKSMERPA